MAVLTMTNREREWQEIARAAVKREQEWERCEHCLRFHPAGWEGGCDDPSQRLPRPPAELVG